MSTRHSEIRLVCASHSPLQLGFLDAADAAAQAGFFAAIGAAREWLREFDPELYVIFGPDHFNGFFFDLMPSFCIGIAAHSTRDWGIEQKPLKVDAAAARGCIDALRAADFDVAVSHRMRADHGITIPLLQLTGALDAATVLPIFINCAADPRPGFGRVRLMGEAVGRYLGTLGKRIVVVASGGLSHDPPTPKLATAPPEVLKRLIDRNDPTLEELHRRQDRVVMHSKELAEGRGPCMPPNEPWDRRFLERLLAQDIEAFDTHTDAEIDREAGFGGHEVRTWIAAAAAMKAATAGSTAANPGYAATLDYYHVIPEWLTGMAVVRGYALQ